MIICGRGVNEALTEGGIPPAVGMGRSLGERMADEPTLYWAKSNSPGSSSTSSNRGCLDMSARKNT